MQVCLFILSAAGRVFWGFDNSFARAGGGGSGNDVVPNVRNGFVSGAQGQAVSKGV